MKKKKNLELKIQGKCHKWPLMRLKLQLQLNNKKPTELVSFPGRGEKKTLLREGMTRRVFGLKQFYFSGQIMKFSQDD